MMKTERDQVKKKVWEKPVVFILSVKNTNGGTGGSDYEGAFYSS